MKKAELREQERENHCLSANRTQRSGASPCRAACKSHTRAITDFTEQLSIGRTGSQPGQGNEDRARLSRRVTARQFDRGVCCVTSFIVPPHRRCSLDAATNCGNTAPYRTSWRSLQSSWMWLHTVGRTHPRYTVPITMGRVVGAEPRTQEEHVEMHITTHPAWTDGRTVGGEKEVAVTNTC